MIGEIPRFNSEHDDWLVYTERLEQFFELNDVVEEKKKAILISGLGEDIYKTLRDLCFPSLPKEKTFKELVALLSNQFVVKKSIFRERVNFYNAKQTKDETIASWFARLKKLSVDCKFGDRFSDIILDRFVCGLRPSPILDRLCEENEDKLTLNAAVEIATEKETSMKEGDYDDEEGGVRRHRGGRNRRKNNA